MTNLLEVNAIHTFINQFHILEGVSLAVPEGSITALLGRNGAGKTTTLRSIMGLNPHARARSSSRAKRSRARPRTISQRVGSATCPSIAPFFAP